MAVMPIGAGSQTNLGFIFPLDLYAACIYLEIPLDSAFMITYGLPNLEHNESISSKRLFAEQLMNYFRTI